MKTSVKYSKNLLALVIGLFFAFLLLELFLSFYNPFNFRIRGQKIELRSNYTEYRKNHWTDKLDSLIVHSKNGMGFRGPEAPEKFEDYLTILTVGGSTTECQFNSDGKDWPASMAKNLTENFNNIWVNNAGLDGHSTFGHLVLLDDYVLRLKPKIIIFYVGINDMGRKDFNSFDRSIFTGAQTGIRNYLIEKSEVVNVTYNLLRTWRAKKHQLKHNKEMDLINEPRVSMTEKEIELFVEKYQPLTLPFGERLKSIIDRCRAHDIMPVFMTQPILVGEGTDDITGAEMEEIEVWGDEANGKAIWKLLKLYNQTTKKVAAENNCLVLDIAEQIPKSSKYYYDIMHYTDEGSKLLGELVSKDLTPHLMEKFSAYARNPSPE